MSLVGSMYLVGLCSKQSNYSGSVYFSNVLS